METDETTTQSTNAVDAAMGWLTSPGTLTIILTLGVIFILFSAWTFWSRVSRFNRLQAEREDVKTPERPPPDPATRRRMTGMIFTLDRIGGRRKRSAKQALVDGRLDLAKASFQAAAQDNPLERLRGLALIAEHEGEADAAADYYAEMYAEEMAKFGPRHPQTRQGAVLYAAFLREQRPNSPALTGLQETYGEGFGG